MPYADPARQRAFKAKKQRLRQARIRAYLNDIKMSSGCCDCGFNAHPAALHFDHIDQSTKKWDISQIRGGMQRLQVEVAKCVVRCANCHAIKTVTERDHCNHSGQRPLNFKPDPAS